MIGSLNPGKVLRFSSMTVSCAPRGARAGSMLRAAQHRRGPHQTQGPNHLTTSTRYPYCVAAMTAPGDNLSEKLVDGLNSVFGAHPGSRAAHAKGLCCAGTFVATPDVAKLTRAAHMSGRPVPVIVRFSNASGDPTAPDVMGGGAGMAVKFRLGDSESTDLLSIAIPIFPSRTPEDFLQLTQALTPDPTTHLPDK